MIYLFNFLEVLLSFIYFFLFVLALKFNKTQFRKKTRKIPLGKFQVIIQSIFQSCQRPLNNTLRFFLLQDAAGLTVTLTSLFFLIYTSIPLTYRLFIILLNLKFLLCFTSIKPKITSVKINIERIKKKLLLLSAKI